MAIRANQFRRTEVSARIQTVRRDGGDRQVPGQAGGRGVDVPGVDHAGEAGSGFPHVADEISTSDGSPPRAPGQGRSGAAARSLAVHHAHARLAAQGDGRLRLGRRRDGWGRRRRRRRRAGQGRVTAKTGRIMAGSPSSGRSGRAPDRGRCRHRRCGCGPSFPPQARRRHRRVMPGWTDCMSASVRSGRSQPCASAIATSVPVT